MGVRLGVRTRTVGEGRAGPGRAEGGCAGPGFRTEAIAEGALGALLSLGLEAGAAPRPGEPPPPPPAPPDMLLLKKQTEDISSVYEIRERLGS